ncbi:MAG TPA: chemotaxis protein CheW [Spirochaetia bacterium]|nr:chemotaxis protein CheW [Spirochaetia bacterium]
MVAGATLTANAERVRQFINFTVGNEEFGIELLSVREVIRMREITRVPVAPPFVKGIINLRGDIIPLVSLRDRFGLPDQAHGETTRVIVVETKGQLIGLVVDSASQVVRISEDQIDPPPPVLGEAARAYITGVGKLDGRLIVLADIRRFFTPDEVQRLARAASKAAPAASGKTPAGRVPAGATA